MILISPRTRVNGVNFGMAASMKGLASTKCDVTPPHKGGSKGPSVVVVWGTQGLRAAGATPGR